MRGYPPAHLLLFAFVFALMTVPLTRLTARRGVGAYPAAAIAGSPENTVNTVIRIRTAHIAASLSLKLNGKELLPAADRKNPALLIELNTALPSPKEGLECLLMASWPPGTPDTAVTVELEPDGLDAESQTRWSSGGKVAEALTYHW